MRRQFPNWKSAVAANAISTEGRGVAKASVARQAHDEYRNNVKA